MLDDARWPQASALIEEACGARGNFLTFEDGFPSDDTQFFFAKTYLRGEDRAPMAGRVPSDLLRRGRKPPAMEAAPGQQNRSICQSVQRRGAQDVDRLQRGGAAFRVRERPETCAWTVPAARASSGGVGNPIDSSGWATSRLDMVARVLPHLRQYVRVRSALVDGGRTRRVGHRAPHQHPHRGRPARSARADRGDQRQRAGAASPKRRAVRRGRRVARPLGRTTTKGSRRCWPGRCRTVSKQGVSGSMLLRRQSPLPRLALHVKPVSSRDAAHRSRRVAALVLIVDPVSRASIEPDLVEAMLGLTPTETEIAVMLAQGRTLQQIAAATGRGRDTAPCARTSSTYSPSSGDRGNSR